MSHQPQSDDLSPEETARRRDDALRRALNTPPQPKHGKVKESNPSQEKKQSIKRKESAQLGLVPTIDGAEANRLLCTLLVKVPRETIYQLTRLFVNADAPYEAGSVFRYAFSGVETVTDGAVNQIGFRLLEPKEFCATLRTLYIEKFGTDVAHGIRS